MLTESKLRCSRHRENVHQGRFATLQK
uniref:Uncharacterized protein n=1 Tax=Anguilla anguilla TaxID=7936 RepID=A0A0E9SQS9_ANGAN